MWYNKKIWTLLILVLSAGFSCKTAAVKEDSQAASPIDGDETIPRKFKSIYFHNFSNDSYVGEMTGEIRDALSQKFGLQQRFRIEPEKANADIYLYGKIEYYRLIPRDIDELGRVNRYIMTGIVTIWVRPNSKISEENILDKKTVRFDTFYAPEITPYESEFTARQRLVDGLCERIVQSVISGWYSNLKSNEELGYDPAQPQKLPGQ